MFVCLQLYFYFVLVSTTVHLAPISRWTLTRAALDAAYQYMTRKALACDHYHLWISLKANLAFINHCHSKARDKASSDRRKKIDQLQDLVTLPNEALLCQNCFNNKRSYRPVVRVPNPGHGNQDRVAGWFDQEHEFYGDESSGDEDNSDSEDEIDDRPQLNPNIDPSAIRKGQTGKGSCTFGCRP